MFLLVLLACGPDECNVETLEVADDAPLGDLPYTAADVVAAVSGSHAIQVDSASAGVVDATFAVERGEGSALFEDATSIVRASPDDVFWNGEMDLRYAPCFDQVEVPVVITVTSPRLDVDLTVAAMAKPGVAEPALAVGDVSLSQSLPVDTPGLPTSPPDGAREVILHAGLRDGELLALRLYWATDAESYAILSAPVQLPEE